MGMIFIIIFCALLFAAVIYLFMAYNRLIEVKHNVDKAWANIDVLLKQRHDELPKLVETCKQYRDFERTTLAQVIAARSQVYEAKNSGDISALNKAEGSLRMGLGRLFAVAEAYPDLKTSQNFIQLQERISGLENSISDRRELYNEAVNINNVRMEQFPEVLLVATAGMKSRALLEVAEEETKDVDIGKLFG